MNKLKTKLFLIFASFFLMNIGFSQTQQTNNSYDFSLMQYSDFLEKMKQNPDIVFIKQKDFNAFNDSTKIAVSIRHDVDLDIFTAIEMAKIENKLDIPATYFILHTANYYHPIGDFSTHNNTILNQMLEIQSLGHEIGIHNDLLTLQVLYNISPTLFLTNELEWMRANGLNIYGSASHGSWTCHKYGFINYYFFRYCAENHISENNKDYIIKDLDTIWFEKADFSDFDFTYEGYFLNFTNYYSDVLTSNGNRSNPTYIDFSEINKGNKIVFLFHPVHWSIKSEQNLLLYPNPCKNYFNVHIDSIISISNIYIQIYRLNGELVDKRTENYYGGLMVNIDLPQGLYIVKVFYKIKEEEFMLSRMLKVE